MPLPSIPLIAVASRLAGSAARFAPGARSAAPVPRAPASARTVALIVASAMFMEQLDGTVLATALPTMARRSAPIRCT